MWVLSGLELGLPADPPLGSQSSMAHLLNGDTDKTKANQRPRWRCSEPNVCWTQLSHTFQSPILPLQLHEPFKMLPRQFLFHKRVEFASPKSHVLELRQEVNQALCNPRGHHSQCLSQELGAMELSKVQPYWVTWRKWLRFICLTSVIYEENPTVVRTVWH